MNLNQKNFLKLFEAQLPQTLDSVEVSIVKDAMHYALTAPGKRFRPLLIHSLASSTCDVQALMTLASSLEMIHTYSLIHDDLPAMDNDDLRRGQATVHKKFDEATAILAGDGLLTLAFEHLSRSDLSYEQQAKAMGILASASGPSGMIYGQVLDMDKLSASDDAKTLSLCYQHKTGQLFSAALQLGALLNPISVEQAVLEDLGFKMGRVFQIQDDYLEVISETAQLGKSNRSDINNDKQTYVKLFGLEKTVADITQQYEELNHVIINLPIQTDNLLDLIDKMRQRMY